MELRLSKYTARQMKRQIRNDYDWDGEEANFADSVLSFAKEYLFPRFKFRRMDGWIMTKDRTAFPHLYRGRYRSLKERITRINGREYMSNHSSKLCHYMVQSQQ
jgi:hypothetical protein